MPVEDVHFIEHQRVDGFFDVRYGKEVPRGIDHESPPFEVRSIVDRDRNALNSVPLIWCLLKQLGVGLEPAEETCVLLGCELPFVGVADDERVGLLDGLQGQVYRWGGNSDGECVIWLGCGWAVEDCAEVEIDGVLNVGLQGRLDEVPHLAGRYSHGGSRGVESHVLRFGPQQRCSHGCVTGQDSKYKEHCCQSTVWWHIYQLYQPMQL